jgi:hypothetical protein
MTQLMVVVSLISGTGLAAEAAALCVPRSLSGSLTLRAVCLSTERQIGSFDGTVLQFIGINVQILDGSGNTGGTPNGRGNLIVGYNEPTGNSTDRSGSHNVIVGPHHAYRSFGGLVAGFANAISAPHATVCGGRANTASGLYSSVCGGTANEASGESTSVTGGEGNTAGPNPDNPECTGLLGIAASVSGGGSNTACGNQDSVSGGGGNTARGATSSISGGENNKARAHESSIGGGAGVITNTQNQFCAGIPPNHVVCYPPQ